MGEIGHQHIFCPVILQRIHPQPMELWPWVPVGATTGGGDVAADIGISQQIQHRVDVVGVQIGQFRPRAGPHAVVGTARR